MPGPGTYYSPDINSSFKESPMFGFGSSQQRPSLTKKGDVPGPGHYRVKSMIADVPKYLIPNQADEFRFV